MSLSSPAARWASLLLLLLASACGPSWEVITQADPNPLQGARSFVLEDARLDAVVYTLGSGEFGEREWRLWLDEGVESPQTLGLGSAEDWDAARHALIAQLETPLLAPRGTHALVIRTDRGSAAFTLRIHIEEVSPAVFVPASAQAGPAPLLGESSQTTELTAQQAMTLLVRAMERSGSEPQDRFTSGVVVIRLVVLDAQRRVVDEIRFREGFVPSLGRTRNGTSEFAGAGLGLGQEIIRYLIERCGS